MLTLWGIWREREARGPIQDGASLRIVCAPPRLHLLKLLDEEQRPLNNWECVLRNGQSSCSPGSALSPSVENFPLGVMLWLRLVSCVVLDAQK